MKNNNKFKTNNNLNNTDLINLGKAIIDIENNTDETTAVINPKQFFKYKNAIKTFQLLNEDNHIIIKKELCPSSKCGYITATMYVFDLYTKNMSYFIEILKSLSAISIDARLDGKIELSMTIPDVFI